MVPSSDFRPQHVHTGSDLQQLIVEKSEEVSGTCVVADLTLGSWTAHSVATQLLGQLTGKELAYKPNSAVSSSLGASMSAGIDEEGRGNRAVLDASRMARQIGRLLEARPIAVVVMLPCYGVPWRTEDRLVIEYLQSLYPSVALTFVTGSDTGQSGGTSLLSLLPGALPPSVLKSWTEEELRGLVRLPNGWALVAPENRRNPEDPASQFDTSQISALKRNGLQQFVPYAMYHSSRKDADPWLFCIEAWKQFGSGSRSLALLYMEAAEAAAKNPVDSSGFTCHRQAMRIAMARYSDAANQPDPEPQLADEAKIFLMETKGWGLVMSGSPKQALPYLRQALTASTPAVVDTAYLFLMNITALAEVRSGNHEVALELERRIENLRGSHGVDDSRLAFVNSINLARLQRYSGDLEQAEDYYRRAFSTVEGARTETDSINVNLCLARIAESRSDYRESFMCWLRAALYWAASDCPESLNWRVQGLILGKGAQVFVESISDVLNLVERLSAAFLEQLCKAGELCGIHVELDRARMCNFQYAGTSARVSPFRYLGGPGWAVMAATGSSPHREYGAMYDRLNRWLSAWIAFAADQEHENWYLIDPRDGMEMPCNWSEFLNSAVDFNLRRLTYNREKAEVAFSELAALEDTREAQISPIVARVETSDSKTVVHFKRYLQPYALTDDERQVFQTLRSKPNIAAARGVLAEQNLRAEEVEQIVARLRKLHILQITRAGIGLSSCSARSEGQGAGSAEEQNRRRAEGAYRGNVLAAKENHYAGGPGNE